MTKRGKIAMQRGIAASRRRVSAAVAEEPEVEAVSNLKQIILAAILLGVWIVIGLTVPILFHW